MSHTPYIARVSTSSDPWPPDGAKLGTDEYVLACLMGWPRECADCRGRGVIATEDDRYRLGRDWYTNHVCRTCLGIGYVGDSYA